MPAIAEEESEDARATNQRIEITEVRSDPEELENLARALAESMQDSWDEGEIDPTQLAEDQASSLDE